MCWSLFLINWLESLFNKDQGLKACNFIKSRLQHKSFPVNIVKFLGTSILKKIYFEEHLLCRTSVNGSV